MVLALLAFLSASTGGWLYYSSLKQAAFHQAEKDADSRLELLRRQLIFFLSEQIKPIKALAGFKELRQMLDSPQPHILAQVHSILDNFKASLDLDVCYLMDREGVTIATSNRKSPDSFMGKDFSFRPYFKRALVGLPTTYMALGTTSGKRGIYYSHPVYDRAQSVILGVVVIKTSVELIESRIFAGSRGVLLVTDPHGVIFIANRHDMKFKLLWDLPREKVAEIRESLQFGKGPWFWSGFSKTGDGYVVDRQGMDYLCLVRQLVAFPDWQIIYLGSHREIERQLADPFIRVIGPVVIILSCLIGLAVLFLYRKALNEIKRRRHAEKELRFSEERYRRIYHKTPVMLHSIDTTGKIIRVSDHWLDTMGYGRGEVIGRPLISFYTKESRQYAEKTIFPEFFRTGFCNDVPYTYVKKNGTTIDTLLSCYGVRNESGEVVRSLAVSVDVTEKNLVQKALQEAKEKLSRYSMDLEQQVEKRTAELKGVQDKLRRLSGAIMDAQERERQTLARELHDHLGQVLTALRIDSVWLEKYLENRDAGAAERAKRLCSLIDDTIGDVREMAFRLRPGVLDDLGLVDALASLTRDFEKRSGISCRFRHSGAAGICGHLATALYRIAQEAVTNALRHSGASFIGVDLELEEEDLILTVTDDGCGFAVLEDHAGLGLTGMRERAILVGGRLEIVSQPDSGTTITCSVKMGAMA